MTTYILVHGRGQERKKASGLTTTWVKALNAGLGVAGGAEVRTADVRLPYYGDALADLVKRRGGKNNSPNLEAVDEVDRLLAAMAAEAAARNGWQPPVREEGFGLPKFLGPALDWLASHSSLDERIIRAHLSDVAYYLADETCRKAVLDIVREAVDGVTGPVVVVGHSLGSVVAYDFVASGEMPRGVDVRLLLTAGSPLGLEIVRNHLPSGARYPAGVRRWVSAYSRNDPVAIGHPIKAFYKGDSKVADLEVSNPGDAAHSIGAYLGHKTVGTALAKA